eukprot:Colp12_sorted_trinity150504_noHs@30732
MEVDISTWYAQIPKVTKALVTGSVAITLLANFGVLNPMYLYLSWDHVVKNFQVWRLLSCFLFHGKLSWNFMINIVFLYRYSLALEEGLFEGRPADYVTMLTFCSALLIVIGFLMPLWILGTALTLSIVYVWSQINRDVIVNFMFGARFKAMYFPWVLVGFRVLIGEFPLTELIGIVVGHGYFFLEYVYPMTGGRRLLETPSFL